MQFDICFITLLVSCWFAAKCNFVYFCRETRRMPSSLLPPIHILQTSNKINYKRKPVTANKVELNCKSFKYSKATTAEVDKKSTLLKFHKLKSSVKKGGRRVEVTCFLLAKSTSLPLKCYPKACV